MRFTEYQTLSGLVQWLKSLESIPTRIVVIADSNHCIVWLNVKSAFLWASEFEERHGIDSELARICLDVRLDDSEPGWMYAADLPVARGVN